MARCYLCDIEMDGRSKDDPHRETVDHVPPQCLFLRPRVDLIDVPCCYVCNHSWHKDDEMLRTFASSQMRRSAAGQKIWETEVRARTSEEIASGDKKERTLERKYIKKEVDAVRRGLKTVLFDTPIGLLAVGAMEIPHEIEAMFIRMTKGWIRHFYPDFDYSQCDWFPSFADPFVAKETFKGLPASMIYTERGDGIFRLKHLIHREEGPHFGLWAFIIYDCFLGSVAHIPPNNIEKGGIKAPYAQHTSEGLNSSSL